MLVVDDNADTLQLFARYAVGTRYAVTGTREPGRALQLAEEVRPDIVVLDVMMPELDGWEMLARLREHPSTAQTSVIICTVLPQQPLALALGANPFLQKPVTREAFLAALDLQTELPTRRMTSWRTRLTRSRQAPGVVRRLSQGTRFPCGFSERPARGSRS